MVAVPPVYKTTAVVRRSTRWPSRRVAVRRRPRSTDAVWPNNSADPRNRPVCHRPHADRLRCRTAMIEYRTAVNRQAANRCSVRILPCPRPRVYTPTGRQRACCRRCCRDRRDWPKDTFRARRSRRSKSVMSPSIARRYLSNPVSRGRETMARSSPATAIERTDTEGVWRRFRRWS